MVNSEEKNVLKGNNEMKLELRLKANLYHFQ